MRINFDCTIIVVTYNRINLLKNCLESIINQKTTYNYEIIVVDNNSNDGTREYLLSLSKKYDFIKNLVNNSSNISEGRNLAIKLSSSDILLFIDDDAIASSNWIQKILELFELDKNIKVIGGPMIGNPENEIPSWLSKNSYNYLGNLNHNINSGFIDVFKYHLASCNLAIKKELFVKLGFFKEYLGSSDNRILSVEDIEFLYRVQKFYPNVIYYSSESVVYHFVPAKRLNKKYLFKRAFWVSTGTSYSIKTEYSKLKRLIKIPKHIYFLISDLPCLILTCIFYNNKYFVDKSVEFFSILGWFWGTFIVRFKNNNSEIT